MTVADSTKRSRSYHNAQVVWGNAIADRIWSNMEGRNSLASVTKGEDEILTSRRYTSEELIAIEASIISRST